MSCFTSLGLTYKLLTYKFPFFSAGQFTNLEVWIGFRNLSAPGGLQQEMGSVRYHCAWGTGVLTATESILGGQRAKLPYPTWGWKQTGRLKTHARSRPMSLGRAQRRSQYEDTKGTFFDGTLWMTNVMAWMSPPKLLLNLIAIIKVLKDKTFQSWLGHFHEGSPSTNRLRLLSQEWVSCGESSWHTGWVQSDFLSLTLAFWNQLWIPSL